MKIQRLSLIIAVIAMFALGASSTAFAQSTDEGYNPVGPILLEDVNGSDGSGPNARSLGPNEQGQAGEGASAGGGNLPFTGLDVAFLAGAGGLLLIMGFGMRRLTRVRESAA